MQLVLWGRVRSFWLCEGEKRVWFSKIVVSYSRLCKNWVQMKICHKGNLYLALWEIVHFFNKKSAKFHEAMQSDLKLSGACNPLPHLLLHLPLAHFLSPMDGRRREFCLRGGGGFCLRGRKWRRRRRGGREGGGGGGHPPVTLGRLAASLVFSDFCTNKPSRTELNGWFLPCITRSHWREFKKKTPLFGEMPTAVGACDTRMKIAQPWVCCIHPVHWFQHKRQTRHSHVTTGSSTGQEILKNQIGLCSVTNPLLEIFLPQLTSLPMTQYKNVVWIFPLAQIPPLVLKIVSGPFAISVQTIHLGLTIVSNVVHTNHTVAVVLKRFLTLKVRDVLGGWHSRCGAALDFLLVQRQPSAFGPNFETLLPQKHQKLVSSHHCQFLGLSPLASNLFAPKNVPSDSENPLCFC